MKRLIVFALVTSSVCTTSAQSGVDLIVTNANVRTMASAQPRAEAIAVSGGEIVAVGSNKSIQSLADVRTTRIDAKGRLVLPGFNDAHVHFAAVGNIFSSIKLSDIRSPKEFTVRIAYFTQFLPKGRWILGSGWDNRNWVPNDPPTRELIDEVSQHNPVFIYNWDASSVLVNAAALKLGGINAETKDPVGGTIFRDAKGEPTGVLRGSAIQLVGKHVPQDHVRDWPEILQTASNYAASFGVTSVQDTHSDDIGDVLSGLSIAGKLKTRIYDCVSLTGWKELAARGVKTASGDAMVRTGCVKYFVEDEADDDLRKLEQDIAGADKAGLQVAIHAIGSKPNETVLNIFEKVTKDNGPLDRRFRVEHASRIAAPDLPRFAKINAITSMQPWLFFGEGGNGPDDYKRLFGIGTSVAFGSDAPIADLNPLLGIHAAVNSRNGISVEQAIRAYTLGSAFAEFQEKVKGTIEVGKLADIVILSEDIFDIDRGKIRNVEVELTIINGKVIYRSK